MANGIRTGDPPPIDSIKDVVWSFVKVPEFDKHLMKAGGHIGRNVVEITIKMNTIVWKSLMIKIHQASSQKFRQLKSYWMKWNTWESFKLFFLLKVSFMLKIFGMSNFESKKCVRSWRDTINSYLP